MKFNDLMHIAFFTDNMEEMMDFYVNKLGAKVKALVRYNVYLDHDDRPAMQEIAKIDPNRIFNVYLEISKGQFIELFIANEDQKPYTKWNEHKGYSHFALTVDDIFKVKEELLNNGVKPDTGISKGPSETYQMWISDPDGNKFEIMQYTENSIQLKGNC